MPRPVWSGAISFGLVNVPVRLHPAIAPQDVRFHQLHAPDGSRIRNRRVCSADGQEVAQDELVRGYEVGPDHYVTVSDEELEALAPVASRAIEIAEFVEADQIDPIRYERTYHVVPDDVAGASKGYALLASAMEEAGRIALGTLVLRAKEHLVAVRPHEGGLALSTLLYDDELVPAGEIPGIDGDAKLEPKQVKTARALIGSLKGDLDLDGIRDTYREELRDLVERKAAGQEIVVEPGGEEDEEQPAAVTDLMAALEASLEAARKGRDGDKPGDGDKPAAKKRGKRAS